MSPCRQTMNERGQAEPLVIHGWTVFAHPLFLAQLEALAQQVEALKQKAPLGYVKKNANKRLAAITKLAFDVIPQDPTRPEYRQGKTLGDEHKHWFRAKFFQQYRLFFRYHAPSKVIVFAPASRVIGTPLAQKFSHDQVFLNQCRVGARSLTEMSIGREMMSAL